MQEGRKAFRRATGACAKCRRQQGDGCEKCLKEATSVHEFGPALEAADSRRMPGSVVILFLE